MAKKPMYGEKVAYDQSAGKRYSAIPKSVTDSANFQKLSYVAKAMLLEAATMFNGRNNGNICLAHSLLEGRGWSKRKVMDARNELEYYRFINVYRKPINRQPTLYELAWVNVQQRDESRGLPATRSASATYLVEKPKYKLPKKKVFIQSETVSMLSDGVMPSHSIPEEFH